jgi:hypothetical protein
VALRVTAILIRAGSAALVFAVLNDHGWSTFASVAGGVFTLVLILGAVLLPRRI